MGVLRLRQVIGAVALSLLAVLASPGSGLAADLAHTVTVSGEGAAKAEPNQAQLSAGVTTTAVTADAALAENARKMNAVIDALKRMGVPERSIQTSNFSVSPQYPPYNQNASGLQRVIGYQVSNQVDVTLDDTKKLGGALDALVKAGANQVNSVGFSIRDADALLATAREAAVADAMKRAQTYAHAAGLTLGGVISIQEGSGQESRPMDRMTMAAAPPSSPTPTAAGEQSVTATVSMVFEIK